MDLIKSETSTGSFDAGDEWETVVHRKHRQKKNWAKLAAKGGLGDYIVPIETLAKGDGVFDAPMVDSGVEDESDGAGAARDENLKAEETQEPLVTLPEAAAKIDHSELAEFLTMLLDNAWYLPTLQILKYYLFINEDLSKVSFPWEQVFKEPTFSTLVDVPISHIPKPVYDVSVEWIKTQPSETLGKSAVWASDIVLTDWAKQYPNSKLTPVGAFVALAMVLRGKPDALAFVVPKLKKDPNYQEQDRILLIVWMTAQASQVDLYAGLYSWAHYLLPVAGDKSGCRRKSMDLILQLVENILSKPKALTTLVSGAVRKGQRLIPVSSFEILMRLTFPAPSARTNATKRFEAIYPLLKQVALLAPENATGSKRMKEIFTFSLELAEEDNPVLAEEATVVAIWSLTENADCFKLWDNLYTKNLYASLGLLKKLAGEWKDHSIKLSSSPRDALTVSHTLEIFRQKNQIAAILQGRANCSLHNIADYYCKHILGMRRGYLIDVGGATYVLGCALAAATALVRSFY